MYRTKLTPVLLLLLLATTLLITPVLGQTGSGKITGVVLDKITGESLPGANVFIKGTSLGSATNVDGKYTIPRVSPGNYTLIVKYIGYKEAQLPVNIIPGRTLELNAELEYAAIEGEAVEITAQAEGQIEAINQQLSARTIKNVVAADRIQEIPDVNAAESVSRLPGISIIRSGGEGQKVAIRGMSPKYNVMMINGVRMQSTDRNDRSVDLNMISPNILSGIEVTKALTADMDADAVGGTVNLKINKAKEGFHSNFTAQGGYGSVADEYGNYRANGLLSRRFFSDNLGVQISGSIDKFDRSSDVLSAGYAVNEEAVKIQDLSEIDLSGVSIKDAVTTRKRVGGGLILDYQLPNGSLLFNNFISNLSQDQVTMSNNLSLAGYQFTASTSESEASNTVYSNALQGEFEFFNMKMDFSLSNSVSKQDRPGDLVMSVIAMQNQAAFTTELDETATPSEFLNGANVTEGIFRTNRLTSTKRDVTETERNAMVNFELPYNIKNVIAGNFKFGAKYRYNKRDNDETVHNIKPDRHRPSQVFTVKMIEENLWPELGLSATDTDLGIRAELFEDPDYDIGNFLSGKEDVDKFFYTGDVEKMNKYEALAIQYDSFFLDPQSSFQRDYNYKRDLFAYYFMTEMNLGKYLIFMPGMRYEEYETNSFAFGTEKYGPEWYDYRNEELTSVRKDGNWFPQLHLQLKPVAWLDVRLASTKSIIYPDYRAFSPYYYYNSNSGPSLSLGNLELQPAVAQNYDVYASVYENRIGLFTFGYFYKEMEDLITGYSINTKDSEKINNRLPLISGSNTSVSTWINLEETSYVRGFEVDWQTNFWYLPSILRGAVFNINYTRMESETSYPFQVVVKEGTGIWAKSVLIDSSRTGRMPNQPNDIINTTLGYDFKGFSARLSFVFQGNVLGGIASRKEMDPYTDDYYRWDLIINQKLPWDGFQFYCNVNNITNRPDRRFVSVLELLSSANYYGRTADVGIRYKF